jgi:hypothetical protein
MVEPQPSKLMTRVRFPSPAPSNVVRSVVVELSSPEAWLLPLSSLCRCPCGSVVEHSLGKGEVTRSIRVMGTTDIDSRFL